MATTEETILPRERLAFGRAGSGWMIYIIREDRFLHPYHSVPSLEEVEPTIQMVMREGNRNPFSD